MTELQERLTRYELDARKMREDLASERARFEALERVAEGRLEQIHRLHKMIMELGKIVKIRLKSLVIAADRVGLALSITADSFASEGVPDKPTSMRIKYANESKEYGS